MTRRLISMKSTKLNMSMQRILSILQCSEKVINKLKAINLTLNRHANVWDFPLLFPLRFSYHYNVNQQYNT